MKEAVVEAEMREVRPERGMRCEALASKAWATDEAGAASEAGPAKARSGTDCGEMRASGHTAHSTEGHATAHAAVHATRKSAHAASAHAAPKSTSSHAAAVPAATTAAATASPATESRRCEGEASYDRSRDK